VCVKGREEGSEVLLSVFWPIRLFANGPGLLDWTAIGV